MALITDQVKFNPKATSSAPSGVAGAVYYDSDINQLMSYDTAYSGVDDNVETDLEQNSAHGAQQFLYTSSDQTWTVPSGVTIIHVKLWGGAGGGGYHSAVCYGGAGGYTEGLIKVVPAETLCIMVGARGEQTQSSTPVYGGGGARNHGYNTSSGAGRTAIFRGSNSTTLANELATAGGGGGGAENYPDNNHAGAGGGLRGQDACYSTTAGNVAIRAGGGTQSSKGVQRGNANASLAGDRCIGGNASTVPASGGGGGGYYGGGAGKQDESGAGGSGYIGGMIKGITLQGDANKPARANFAYGNGGTTQASNGQYGTAVISW